MLTLMDARGNTASYTYDSMNRVATQTDPLGHSESFAYDLNGNLSQHTNRKGQVATFTYDALNRRTGDTYADATVALTFDAVGRLSQATDSVGGAITRVYDILNRLMSETTSLGTVSYQYDMLGRRTQMTAPNQTAVAYAYDAASRLTSITQGGSVVQFAYDAANRRMTSTLPNGVSTEYGYDAASQLRVLTYKLGATTLGDLQYLYDAGGNRIQVAGSWARAGLPPAVASATYNANNQQVTFASQNVTYDLNGNLTSDGTNTYTWDARNRMTAVTGPVPVSFVYDATGRRSRKTVSGVVTDFLYDVLNPVQEQSGSSVVNLLTGLGVDEYLSRSDAMNTAFFLTDALGSTVSLTDSSGMTATNYTYEPFGGTSTTGVSTSNPFDFTGRESDFISLKYYRARYYHSGFQRFVSEDSSAINRAENLYVYVDANPILYTDPLGLYTLKPGVVEPKKPVMVKLLRCMDACLGRDVYVTETQGGHPPGTAHPRGDAVDLAYDDPDKLLCCAALCGAKNARDELKHPTKDTTAPHIHVSLVPGWATNPGGPRGDLPTNTCPCR